MDTIITDRRTESSDRHLSNRRRFLDRGKDRVKRAVRESLRKAAITDVLEGGEISIPYDGIDEPQIARDAGGVRGVVLPGNQDFVEGDILKRQPAGTGGQGNKGAGQGDGDTEDAFRFVLTREEFLRYFLEDLELPELVRRGLSEVHKEGFHRAGYTHSGPPSRLAVVRTMLQAMGRRIGLHRPKKTDLELLEEGLKDAKSEEGRAWFENRINDLKSKQRRIPYIDEMDLRYRRLEPEYKPITKAVMFCLMDVSGSMTEHMKDLAKRFYMLLYVFLKSRYPDVSIVFIRHTDSAEEVDEKTFFYDPKTGGTTVSAALILMQEIVKQRYPLNEWNIYAAQSSDGDSNHSDEKAIIRSLGDVLPLTQYYAYLEVHGNEPGAKNTSRLWALYQALCKTGMAIAMRKVQYQSEIFPVFAELFARGQTKDGQKQKGGVS